YAFFDDFDDGNAEGWTAVNQAGVRPGVVGSPEGYALRGVGKGEGGAVTERLVRRLGLANATEVSVEMRARAGAGAGNVAEVFLLAGTSVAEGMHYWMWDRGESAMNADWIVGNYDYVYNYEMGDMAYGWHDYKWWRDGQGWWSFSIDGELKGNRVRGDVQWISFENLAVGVGRDESEIEWVKVTAIADPPAAMEPIEMPGTGHYYERADVEWPWTSANWNDARDRAAGKTYRGMTGHLATIGSKAENEFIERNVVNYSPHPDYGSQYWVGGNQAADGAEPGGGWGWVGGETWSYTNWAEEEWQPDNGARSTGLDEDALLMWGIGEGSFWGKWRDLNYGYTGVDGYVVEYEAGAANTLVVDGQTVTLGVSKSVESVVIKRGSVVMTAGGGKVLSTGTLSISDGGVLDVNDNSLIVKGERVEAVANLVRSGCNGGAWDGFGIRSSTAKSRPGGFATLGVVLNDQGDGTPMVGSVGGVAVVASDVIVKYTWNGDANMDGKVNADDYFMIDSGFIAMKKGWYNGDFNYDGKVNADDYFLIDSGFIGQVGTLSEGSTVAVAGAEVVAARAVGRVPLGRVRGKRILEEMFSEA
ncbi:MAG: hypothetical protein NTU53_16695, partial [Planctomycetota bacterium]|nr:hypothetical protein [Planctomycetota bacterium]